MPESKVRKPAAEKGQNKNPKKAPSVKKAAAAEEAERARKAEAETPEAKAAAARDEARAERTRRLKMDRSWVPWVFVPVGIVGVLWLVVFYLAGAMIPFMAALGDWNILIGMGSMAAAFAIATFWR